MECEGGAGGEGEGGDWVACNLDSPHSFGSLPQLLSFTEPCFLVARGEWVGESDSTLATAFRRRRFRLPGAPYSSVDR